MWTWVTKNPLIAVIIVVLSLVATASAVDSYRQRKTAEGYLKDAQEQTDRLKEAEKTAAAWQTRAEGLETRVRNAEIRETAARKRLDEARAAAGRPFVPPAGPGETANRFGKLGYKGRMK